MLRVDLVNDVDFLFDSVPCTETRPAEFAVRITADVFARWKESGQFVPQDQRLVYVRAGLDVDGKPAMRKFAAIITAMMRSRPDTGLTYYYSIAGTC